MSEMPSDLNADQAHLSSEDLKPSRSVISFLVEALRRNEAALIIATKSHILDCEKAFTEAGLNVAALEGSQRLVFRNAIETLEKLMSGSQVDSEKFRTHLLGEVEVLQALHRNVIVYGEMVGLLWEAGNKEATLKLEKLWAALAKEKSFTLLSAYRAELVQSPSLFSGNEQLKDAHDRLLAELQQRERALENEISKRNKIEEALRQNQLQLNDFFDNSIVGLHWVGPDGIILRANKAELEMLGYTESEYIGKPITDFHVDDHVIQSILERLSRGEAIREQPVRLKCKDGSVKYGLIDSNVFWQNGKFVHTRCFTRDITNQKRTESELAISAALRDDSVRTLDQIFTESPSFMCFLRGPEFIFERANDQYLTLIGKRDIISKRAIDVLPEVEAQGFIELLKGVYTTKNPFVGKEIPLEIVEPFGKRLIYIDFVYQALTDTGGNVYGIAAQGYDVTEKVLSRKSIERSKDAIQNERENFRNLFKETPQFVAILAGPEHRFEFVNDTHVQMLGFNATGKTVREAQPESEEVFALLEGVYTTGKTAQFYEIPITLGDRLRNFDVTYSPRRDLDGSINGIMVLGIESTQRVDARLSLEQNKLHAEHLLAELESKSAQLEAIIDNIPMSVIFAEAATGKLIFSNKQFEKIWRHPFRQSNSIKEYDEYVGYHADGRRYEGKDWPLARTLLTGISILNEDTIVGLGDGTQAVFSISSAPIRNNKGEVVAAVVISEDVTDRRQAVVELKKAKEEAERANELKSAFLANMSHEIRTPLGAMVGFADLLRDPSLSREEHTNFINILTRNGEQLSSIINDILDLSKVEAGHLTLELEDANPALIATDVVTLLNVKAKEKNIRLSFTEDASTPKSVVTDPLRVRQIIMNIVGNAIKFTQFGSVTVRSFGVTQSSGGSVNESLRPDTVAFEITDSGIGIPGKETERIFEAFVQADGTSIRRFGGTGLGLALSRQLARKLGGDVLITHTEEGKGSTFLVTIQNMTSAKVPKHVPVEQEQPLEPSANILQNCKALVVDDSPDNRSLIRLILQKYGANIEFAENGLQGYQKALAGNYDVVLMDIQMPEMDGYTATLKLREAGYQKPIIALTAHAMSEVRLKCLDVGCTDHLTKPIKPKELVATIARHL